MCKLSQCFKNLGILSYSFIKPGPDVDTEEGIKNN